MKTRNCLLCGRELPPLRWWRWMFLGTPPPRCNLKGLSGDMCWAGLSRRLGIENPGPRPR